MQSSWNTAGTACHQSLRILCVWLVLAGQSVLWSGGCNQVAVNGNENTNGNTNGNENVNDNANDNANGNINENDNTNADTNGNANDTGPPAGTLSVDGYWISTRDESGATLRGLATGGQFDDAVSITIAESDGRAWSFSGGFEGDALDGTCSPSPTGDDFDVTDLFADPLVCRGEFTDDGDTLTLTADDGSAVRTWVLERPADPTPMLIGSWTDEADAGARLVTGYDGAVLAVLDPDDTSRRFDAVADESGGFSGADADGNRWIGLPYGDGSELFVWSDDFGTFIAQHTYTREQEPATFAAPLTGRWMSSYNNGELTNALRGQASLIFDGNHLYAYQRDDNHRILFESDYTAGGYWSIFATFDGQRFQSTPDSTTTWSGTVDPTGTVIHGYWSGDDTRAFGFAKTFAATPSDLAGAWSSVSTDYESPSEPTQSTGSAQVSFDGQTLVVEDSYANADYVIEAEWLSDHFEGQWWSTDDPGNRLRWTGEVLLDGALLHGKWEYGEWSLSPFPMQTRASLGETASDTLAIVADPFDDILASYHNDAAGVAVTVYRGEGIVKRYSIVGHDGNVDITVDERYRPRSVVGPDLNMTLVWAEDSSSVEATVDDNGTITTETVAIDLSDQALLDMLTTTAAQTGANLDALRDWVTANPGRLAAIARGDEAAPVPGGAFAKRANNLRAYQARNANGMEITRRVVTDGATIGGLIWGIVAATTAAGKAATLTGAIAFGGIGFLAAVAVGFLVALFLWEFLFACFPCTLSCFWNCGLP